MVQTMHLPSVHDLAAPEVGPDVPDPDHDVGVMDLTTTMTLTPRSRR